jgi:alcohol dehydrogenase, propanol-preferring
MGSVEVPSRHKALVYDNPGKISTKIEEVETPKPGVGEVLVNLTHSGGSSSFATSCSVLTSTSVPLCKTFPTPVTRDIQLTYRFTGRQDMGVMCNAWSWLPAPTQAGQVGGHEGVGTIAALGTGADSSGLKVGDRVGIKWLAYACTQCEPCLAGAEASCTTAKISG